MSLQMPEFADSAQAPRHENRQLWREYSNLCANKKTTQVFYFFIEKRYMANDKLCHEKHICDFSRENHDQETNTASLLWTDKMGSLVESCAATSVSGLPACHDPQSPDPPRQRQTRPVNDRSRCCKRLGVSVRPVPPRPSSLGPRSTADTTGTEESFWPPMPGKDFRHTSSLRTHCSNASRKSGESSVTVGD